MTDATGWNRRDVLGAASLVALAFGLPLAAVEWSAVPAEDQPGPADRALLREVSQLVIPRTATPGAGDVGAGDFVLLALAHGLDGSRRPPGAITPDLLPHLRPDGSLRHAAWLAAELDRRRGGRFMAAAPARRAELLAALDAEAFAEGAGDHPWRTIKALILTGYYTTEIGGSRELRYELVPGRYDPDLPATPQTVAFSSDWTAVDFG
ncbi:gluconate 2-dehydrogenase subunit 3 family protein [Novosphingobium sp.]|uniref:gluconate 2-dehydrogenase subunit 3 family protein n=1 Tax=Novosphingobium sp. TaxID=1874826 RepID=UPI00261485B8|nr:gluconate 2-dehydrogenase subunit 3 family protein [Novosphingobium sp.]